MSLLIKNAKIIIPNSSYNGRRYDILIEKGKIKKIEKNIRDSVKIILKSKNVCVSIGWMDIGVFSGEPGLEHRETLNSLEQAAFFGGYTALAIMPNTSPCLNSKSELQYFNNNRTNEAMNYYPIGAASKDCKGEDLNEYIDMSKVGAVAFSDGNQPIKDDGFMMRSMLYAKVTDSPILNIPLSSSMASHTHMHEGNVSTRLGLKANPDIAEQLVLQRDITLLEYTKSRYISHLISSNRACRLIKESKKKSLNISATVSYNNLLFTDKDVIGFDTNYKLEPPLRTKRDQSALITAVKDDIVDAIVTDHRPLEIEAKKLEFPYADFGALGLQTSFGALWKNLNKRISLSKLVEKLSIGPRRILNIEIPPFDVGSRANITIFDPSIEWEFEEQMILSKSKNSPWIGKELQGKVLGICNNGVFVKV